MMIYSLRFVPFWIASLCFACCLWGCRQATDAGSQGSVPPPEVPEASPALPPTNEVADDSASSATDDDHTSTDDDHTSQVDDLPQADGSPAVRLPQGMSDLSAEVLKGRLANNPQRDDFLALAYHDWKQQRYDDALTTLLNAEVRLGPHDDFDQLYREFLSLHPDLNAPPRQLFADKDISAIKKQGGGSTLVYRLLQDNRIVAAFKPRQTRLQSNFLSELAAYRLCPRIKCAFDVPTSHHVYFDHKPFSGLYARIASNPKAEFSEITVTRTSDDWPEGTPLVIVEGVAKEWIYDFVLFPIELSSLWLPWFNLEHTPQTLRETSFDALLSGIRKRHPGGDKFAKALEPHLQSITPYDLARQIANMIVFDFLINNWDRFSGKPEFWGVNCQFKNGRFVSIDNGAAFSKTPHPKPEKWLHSIQRFSKTAHRAIENLDKEETYRVLFQNPSDYDESRYETFWQQRQRYLDYVQSLIDANGIESTLFFD
ncbi:MAG: hypothetical protein FWC40_02025 [Proteobacteria bacterium]|nr:hypothetical protein [Pseudomonadota bacterium]